MLALDQRVDVRIPFAGDVVINGSILVRGIDLSEGGLYVHTGRSIKRGSVLDVSFRLGPRLINVKARVSYSQESVGMGLRFIDLDDGHRCAIRSYVESYSKESLANRKKKVLLVEDNEANRRMNKSRLVLDGYSVFEATDGIDAISKLAQCTPDLVILDLYMDRMNGFKLLSYMKGDKELKRIPVIVLSARGVQVEMDRAISLGADGFLLKMMTSPVKLSEYIGKILK